MNAQSLPLNLPCLTVLQPLAELIASGRKRIENRSWPTKLRGWLLIHAGKTSSMMGAVPELRRLCVAVLYEMSFGSIVAICRVVDCVHIRSIERGETRINDAQRVFASGPWCWMLADIQRLPTPIPYRGAQGLFMVPASVVADQLKAVRRETA